MKTDYVTAQERVSISSPPLEYYVGHECVGCGRTSEQIAAEEGWNDFDFDSESKTTNCGHWYCHIDCYRDSH